MQKFVHKTIDGTICLPFHIWVAECCSEEDKKTHDDPNPENVEKQKLIQKYYQENNVYSMDIYENDVLIENKLLKHLINIPNTGKNDLLFVYKTKEGEICKPFHQWIAECGTEEELALHINPDESEEKAELLSKYFKEVNAYSMHVYEDGILIDEDLLEEIIIEIDKIDEGELSL